MNPLRSVGARLGLGLAMVVALALVLVGLIVVPSLENNLIKSKLGQLREEAPTVAQQVVASSTFTLVDTLQSAASSSNARVVWFNVLTASPLTLTVYADSNSISTADVQNDRIALAAYRNGSPATGTVSWHGQRYAESAVPVAAGVVLLRASLRDSLRSIALVRRRLVIAGLIALAASLLVGYLAAALFARRIRRLERAADRIAGGDFSEPVTDAGRDELGDLAGTFERMRQRLARLEHARREFIANASHELRTPLFSLGGFLELMSEEDLDVNTRIEFLATMREQIERLTKLATELLDLSRLDAGRMRVEREPVDLVEVAETLVGEFRAVARAGDHVLEVEGSDTATALADEERALQIGRILVENALVHTPAGTGVRLRVARRESSVVLTVEDEGPGIPVEHAEEVFERFYRVEGSVASGSGLGLAIARELAELMGGAIELRMVSGRTIFALVLPAAAADFAVSRENRSLKEPSLQ